MSPGGTAREWRGVSPRFTGFSGKAPGAAEIAPPISETPLWEPGASPPYPHANAEVIARVVKEFNELNPRAPAFPLDEFPYGSHSAEIFGLEEMEALHIVHSADSRGLANVAEISQSPPKGMITIDENCIKRLPSKIE